LASLLIAGCLSDVAHENPLDPQSDEFNPVGSASITVTQFYPPFDALPGVEVRFFKMEDAFNKKLVRIETTGSSGAIMVNELEEGNYELVVSLEGFSTVVDTVAISIAESVSRSVLLDGLPVVRANAVATVHISRWFPSPQDLFSLELDVLMDDPDGVTDIDSVWLDIPSIGLTEALLETPTLGRFANTISENQLGGFTLQQILGVDVCIRAVDSAGYQNAPEPVRLVRVLETTPVAVSPQGEALLTIKTPELSWETVRLPFEFRFQVDIIREETNIQVLVESQKNILSTLSSIIVSNPLIPGDYFWTVSIVDAFGNRSRSKEAGFRIQ